jgi:hypothetical protein
LNCWQRLIRQTLPSNSLGQWPDYWLCQHRVMSDRHNSGEQATRQQPKPRGEKLCVKRAQDLPVTPAARTHTN